MVRVADLLREDLADEFLPRVVEAARKLYPVMAPSPTARGYWHIRTRTGFSMPRFDRRRIVEENRQEHEFCAVYHRRKPVGKAREDEGVPATLFTGGFSERSYDVVDRTFRVLTDEVLEPGWSKLNRGRGRSLGGWAGVAAGMGATAGLACAGFLGGWFAPVDRWLSVFPPPYRLSAWAALGAVAVVGFVTAFSGLLRWLLGGLGAWCERSRLRRRLPAAAAEFLYGPEATGPLCREFAMASAEERKEREFRRYEEAGAPISREEFARFYEHLPSIKQLAMTEDRRREEVLALAARLGPGSRLDPMALIEPYLHIKSRIGNTGQSRTPNGSWEA